MSISDKLIRLQNAKTNICSAIEKKNIAVPTNIGFEDFPALIEQIEQNETNSIPEEYTRLKEIVSSGTQYINTGFKPNQDTRVIMDAQIIEGNESTTQFLFGARETYKSKGFSFCWHGTNKCFRPYYGSEVYSFSTSIEYTDNLYLDFNKTSVTLNDESMTLTSYTFTAPVNMCIFAVNNNGTNDFYASMRLRAFKIYDNGTLVRDYVPVKVNSSGEIGLYDKMTKEFFGNAGTGSFQAVEDTPSVSVSMSILDNLANPALPKFGRIKYIAITNNSQGIRYNDIRPSEMPTTNAGVEIKYATYADSLVGKAYLRALFTKTQTNPIVPIQQITVDGKIYDAYAGCTGIVSYWFTSAYQNAVASPAVYLPPCVCRIAGINASTSQIEIQEYTIDNTITSVMQPATTTNGAVNVAAGNLFVTTSGLSYILGAEFIYEKHNIMFSGNIASLKCSEDEGVNFSQVTNNMNILDAEHIVLRNDGSETINIGSTSGGSDIVTISSGQTIVVPLTSDGTWYVS